jgi:hypothetical protein
MSRNKDARREAKKEQKEAKKMIAALSLNLNSNNYRELPDLSPDNQYPVGQTCCCLSDDCLDRKIENLEASAFIADQFDELQQDALNLGINPWETKTIQ